MIDNNHAWRIFCAIDTNDCDRAKSLALAVSGQVGGVKVGLEFFSAHGPYGVSLLTSIGLPVFLDLKLFDIPNTVAGAVAAAAACRPAMITLHASGGGAMMRAAVEANKKAAHQSGNTPPLLLGVTVLTSFDRGDLREMGVEATVAEQVSRLAVLAQASGLDGVVCSAHEIAILRSVCGGEFKLVVPGIRPKWAESDDQKRFLEPGVAVAKGADYLVVGRPISQADDPAAAARLISEEISEAMGSV